MATAFKKPNLSQSVEELEQQEQESPVMEMASKMKVATNMEELFDDEEDSEAGSENDELHGEVSEEVAAAQESEEAKQEGGEEWPEGDQVELGEAAEPVASDAPPVSPPASAPIAASSPTDYTDADSLLDEIENAEKDCAEAESQVNEIKEDLKRAKKRYDTCVDHLRGLARKVHEDNNRPLFKPKPVAPASPAPPTEATDVAPDSGQVVSDAAESCSEEALPNWQTIKLAALEQHGVSAAVIEKLAENQINTLGELESLRAEISNGKAKWPKGIGEKKITAIENAVVTFLAAHQYSDSTSVPVTQVDDAENKVADSGDEDDDYETLIDASNEPTAKAWEAMSHGEQIGWLNARAVYLETTAEEDDELEAIDVLDYRNTDSEIQWQEGVDSYSEDDTASNCPYGPGEDCDAWLQGWLWAGKQDTLDTNLPPKQ